MACGSSPDSCNHTVAMGPGNPHYLMVSQPRTGLSAVMSANPHDMLLFSSHLWSTNLSLNLYAHGLYDSLSISKSRSHQRRAGRGLGGLATRSRARSRTSGIPRSSSAEATRQWQSQGASHRSFNLFDQKAAKALRSVGKASSRQQNLDSSEKTCGFVLGSDWSLLEKGKGQ